MNLQTHFIQSSSGLFFRNVWLLEAIDDKPSQLAVFLDGEFYVNQMGAPAIIHQLQQSGAMPSTTCLFVSHVDGAARHQDLTCNPAYTDFIARDLVGWIRQRQPTLSEDGHLIAGPSLGGLAAAFTALIYPQIFSRCLSQSGSFWWKDEWLTSTLTPTASPASKFWLSVGDLETSFGISHPPSDLRQEVTQIDACERFAKGLKARHCPVHYSVYEGGHVFEPWQEELPEALQWLTRK